MATEGLEFEEYNEDIPHLGDVTESCYFYLRVQSVVDFEDASPPQQVK